MGLVVWNFQDKYWQCYMTSKTICLNMIVKDESHIIEETLIKLLDKMHFDYWVISDTGSSDNTKEIITKFFNSKDIKGELHDDEWVDFAFNRTKALEYALNKTDYVFIFDADDTIYNNFKIPNLVDDGYYIKFGNENGYKYKRMLLVNNRKKWKYKSVIHEFITCCDVMGKTSTIEGDYYVCSGKNGNRSLQPDKYLKDAMILEKAYINALSEKDDLHTRYAFYCANSYYDCNHYNDAIKWYKIVLNQNNWTQEKYISCIKLYECYQKTGMKEISIFYLVESIKYDDRRVEGIVKLVCYYLNNGMSNVAYKYYEIVQKFFESEYNDNSNIINDKLFINNEDYRLTLPYYMIIVSDRVKCRYTGIKMYEIIFKKKHKTYNEFYIGNMLHNLQFFIKGYYPPEFIVSFQEYIDFLHDIKYPLHKHACLKMYNEYGLNTDKIFIN